MGYTLTTEKDYATDSAEHTAHDTSIPFVAPLIDYVRDIATSPQTQHIKLIGICFGHQIISIAMGGKCERGENGWEVGVYGNETTEQGRYWWCGDVNGQGGDDRVVSLQDVPKTSLMASIYNRWYGDCLSRADNSTEITFRLSLPDSSSCSNQRNTLSIPPSSFTLLRRLLNPSRTF